MKFVDEVIIDCRSGDGGDGCVSFRREKYVPRGGPNGGDGGDGGSVVLVADSSKTNLRHLSFRRVYKAKNGAHGSGADKHGRNGEDLLISAPPGALVKDAQSGELLCDLIEYGQRFVIAPGGKGGRGNASFATSTNRAPRTAEKGEKGTSRLIRLELAVLADLGLIGFPSVGKSSLLRAISAARPKVAAYPFTTLSPNLGVATCSDGFSFVAADLPGLIEGASEGQGLGFRFLRHVGRTKALAFVLDLDPNVSPSPVRALEILRNELADYDERLSFLPFAAIGNKIDLPGAKDAFLKWTPEFSAKNIKWIPISAKTGEGLGEMLQEMEGLIRPLAESDANKSGEV